MVYLCNVIASSTKNEQVAYTCKIMDTPQKYYARLIKTHIHMMTFIRNVEKRPIYTDASRPVVAWGRE